MLTLPPGCADDAIWVDPQAKAGGTGTVDAPFISLADALAANGGETEYWLKPGLYLGGLRLTKEFSGSKKHPTKIVSSVKWGARIVGSAFHGIETADDTNWVTIDGFEVMGASYDGIKLSGDNSQVLNCWSHNNGNNGIGCHSRNNNTFTANLVEFNGQNPQFHHGIYVDGAGHTITRNIVRRNCGYGMQLYPGLTGSLVSGNLIHSQSFHAGMIVCPPTGGGKNRITHNTLVGNAGGIELLGGNGEVIVSNILCGPFPVSADATTKDVTRIANLYDWAAVLLSTGEIKADPLFVAPGFDVYWLGKGSPAIGLASANMLPAVDFWGRPKPASDAGCFPYVASLEGAAARTGWRSGWPYRFAVGLVGGEMPDLWTPPA